MFFKDFKFHRLSTQSTQLGRCLVQGLGSRVEDDADDEPKVIDVSGAENCALNRLPMSSRLVRFTVA